MSPTKRHRVRVVNYLLKSSGIVLVLLVWELVSRFELIDPNLFPTPTAVVNALIDVAESGQLWRDILASTGRALLGFVLGSFVGIVTGALTGRLSVLDSLLTPVVQVLRPVPVIALVPLAIVWFGLGETSKIFLVFWGVFFPVWIGTYLGVSRIDKNYIWAARSMGASRRQLWLEIFFPAALPTIMSGLRTSISVAFIVLVAAEMAGSFVGVGYRVSAYHLVFEVDKMMGYIAVLGALGFFADRGFAHLVNKLLPWYRSSRNQD